MANLTTRLYTFFYGTKVGEDIFGNKYYASSKKEGKHVGRANKERRWVIYNGSDEPSKVPPMWHSWLHYTVDDVPSNEASYEWQEQHEPNLTGTKLAYKASDTIGKADGKVWSPKK